MAGSLHGTRETTPRDQIRERGRAGAGGAAKKKLFKTFGVAGIVRQVLQIVRHFDSGLGTWTPTASIHAGSVVSPSLGDILPKRVALLLNVMLTRLFMA
jgi:hypothetical protein